MKEIWKDIKGYEGYYQVSNLGKVKSLNYLHSGKEVILKPEKTKQGYYRIALCVNGVKKRVGINHLVAEAFIPNPENKPLTLFIDGNPSNLCTSNLKWVTHSEFQRYGLHTERRVATYMKNHTKTKKSVKCIETGKIYISISEAARDVGVHVSTISDVCNKRPSCFSAAGYHWEFTEKN